MVTVSNDIVTTLLLNAFWVSLCTGECYGFYTCKAQLNAIKGGAPAFKLYVQHTKQNDFKIVIDYAQAETFQE